MSASTALCNVCVSFAGNNGKCQGIIVPNGHKYNKGVPIAVPSGIDIRHFTGETNPAFYIPQKDDDCNSSMSFEDMEYLKATC